MRLRSHARRLGALSARGPFRFACFAALSLIALWPTLSTSGALNDFRDAQVLVQYEEAARRTVAQFHELPLWNPYYCGGMYGWGTPQARFVSPAFLLTLVLGTLRAEPVIGFFFLLVALEGAWRYIRSRGATALGALLGSSVFGLSGIFACAPFLGWTNFYSFALLPWAAWGARRAARFDLGGCVITALAFAGMVGFGGTYAVPISAVLCAAEVIERSVQRRRRLPWAPALVALLLCLGLSAYRLWPVAETLQRSARLIGGASGANWLQILQGLFGSPPFVHDGGAWYLIGVLAVPAVLAGVFRRRSVSLVIWTTLGIWLAAGYLIVPSLFALLRLLPAYSTLRYPERFLIPVALLAGALAAKGLGRWRAVARVKPKHTWVWAALGALLLINVPFLVRNFHLAANGRTMVAPAPELEREFHQARGNRWSAAYFGPMNRGSLSCWEAYPVPQSPALRGDLAAEEFLEDASAGTVRRTQWSPNRIELQLELSRPTSLLVNQNHHPGWRASAGEVISREGLLGVKLPAGQHQLTLRFRPWSAMGGALTSLVALLAIGLLWQRRAPWGATAPGQMKAALVAAVPVVLGGVLLAASPEVFPEPPMPQAFPGQPVVAEAPPPGMNRLDVDFESGVRLEAVASRLVSTPEGQAVVVEIDWRLTERLRRAGVFIHVEPEGQKRFEADHALISGAFTLEDAPLNRTLRDVLVIDAAAKHRGRKWRIWAGLWKLFGDGSRLEVLRPGAGQIHEHRVLVGTIDVPPDPKNP